MAWIHKNRRTTMVLAALALFLFLFWIVRSNAGDEQLENVQALRSQLAGDAGKKLSADQRKDVRQKLGQEMKKLSPQQRQELGKEQRKAMQARMEKFFKSSKKEQIAQLDRDIEQMEKARKDWEKNQKGTKAGASGKG